MASMKTSQVSISASHQEKIFLSKSTSKTIWWDFISWIIPEIAIVPKIAIQFHNKAGFPEMFLHGTGLGNTIWISGGSKIAMLLLTNWVCRYLTSAGEKTQQHTHITTSSPVFQELGSMARTSPLQMSPFNSNTRSYTMVNICIPQDLARSTDKVDSTP